MSGFVSCAKLSTEIAATLEEANAYTDAKFAEGAPPTGPAGGGLTGTYPNPGLSTASVVNAVEAGIGADTDAQVAIVNAIINEIVDSTTFKDALLASPANLKNCAGDAMLLNAEVPTCAEMDAAIAGAIGAIPATPDATESAKGIIEIATATEVGESTSTTLAVTPGNLASALNSGATNAMQQAVVNAVQQAIGTDGGAQTAIANAIAGELATAPEFASSVQAAETTTTLALTTGKYVYKNEDAAEVVIQPANFLSTDAGQSLTVGADGKLFVNVIGLLPADAVYSGSNNGNVDISITPDITDPTLFTIEGNLDLATETPTNGVNLLTESAAGFYVSAEEVAAEIADTPAALASIVGGIPAASTTVQGKVELATNVEAVAGTSTTLAVTPAGVAAAVASAIDAIPAPDGSETKLADGTNTSVTGTGTTADPYAVNVADASETEKGAVELATTAEAVTGTSTSLAVTPAGLAANNEALVASTAQAQAWTDNKKLLSPLRLADAFKGSNVSLTSIGYQKLPSGLIIQWGWISAPALSNETINVTLPITFPVGGVYSEANMDSYTPASDRFAAAVLASASTLQVTRINNNIASSTVKWLAIGY